MDGVQKRPLSGMITLNVAAPRAISNVAPTTIHVLDNSTEANGGPFVDMVNLFVANTTGAPIVLTCTVASGTAILQSIAANAVAQIFTDAVFQNAPAVAAVSITAQGAAEGLVFWGDFARVL